MINKAVVCIGAILIDECFTSFENPLLSTSNPSNYFRSSGGVAGNIANHLALLGQGVELVTHFGDDADGKWLMERCRANGIGISHSIVNDFDTGRYVAILSPNGELFAGAMSSHFESAITISYLKTKATLFKSASILQIDCNLSTDCLKWLLEFCDKEKIPCIVEPVSIPKASRLTLASIQNVLLITPNLQEMIAMSGSVGKGNPEDVIQILLERGVKNLWIRNGKKGSKIFTPDSAFELAAPIVNVVDTTGAGDAALAGWIYAWLREKTPEKCLLYGHSMASIILQIKGAVQENLTSEILEKTVKNYS